MSGSEKGVQNLMGLLYNYTYVSDIIGKKKTEECTNQALPATAYGRRDQDILA